MLKHALVSVALACSALIVPLAASAPASAAVQAVSTGTAQACSYGRSGNHWRCITPGAFCPKAAHYKYGYAKVTGRKYRCSRYTATTWRWKRV